MSAAIRLVRFAGAATREGPLTLGQADMLAWILDDAEPTNIFAVWDIPADTALEVVESSLAQLLTRHESLRTTYRLGTHPVQVVAGSGELELSIRHDADCSPASATGQAAMLAAAPFDLTSELPLRAAVVMADRVPRYLLVVVSHVAADMASLSLLADEWAALTQGRPVPLPALVQPVYLAAMEQGPQARRREVSSAAHWEAQLRAAPQCMFAVPGVRDGDASEQPLLLIRSRAAAGAVADVAARTRASSSAVILAAVCAMTSHYTAQPTCLVTSVCANRFSTELASYIGPLSREAVVAMDVGSPAFDDFVRRVHQRAVFSYARASDTTTLAPVLERLGRDRGTWYARDCEFNDHTRLGTRGMAPLAVPDPGDGIQLTWLPGQILAARLTVWVIRLDDLVELALWADPSALPPRAAELFGAGLVRLIEAAATRPVPLADLTELTGLGPVERGAGWVRVGASWVDLDAVRRLVADALLGTATRVAAVPDDSLGHRLVCHVDADLTPEAVHDACMATLPGRPAAMAPHWYVVGAGTTEGDGRRPADRQSSHPSPGQPVVRLPLPARGGG